jgi:hypothetical protein
MELKDQLEREEYGNVAERTQLILKLRMVKDLILSNRNTIERLRNVYGLIMREEAPISGPQWLLLDEAHVEKVPNKNQYRQYKYIFNFHKTKKSGIEVYRCNRYNDLRFPAKLEIDQVPSSYRFVNSHNCSMRLSTTSSRRELSELRWIELYNVTNQSS